LALPRNEADKLAYFFLRAFFAFFALRFFAMQFPL